MYRPLRRERTVDPAMLDAKGSGHVDQLESGTVTIMDGFGEAHYAFAMQHFCRLFAVLLKFLVRQSQPIFLT